MTVHARCIMYIDMCTVYAHVCVLCDVVLCVRIASLGAFHNLSHMCWLRDRK